VRLKAALCKARRPLLDSHHGAVQAGTPMTVQGDGAGNTLRRFTLTSVAPSQRDPAMDSNHLRERRRAVI
jgi:hypothetical protein